MDQIVTPQDRYRLAANFVSTAARRTDEIWAEDFIMRYTEAQTGLDYYIPAAQKLST